MKNKLLILVIFILTLSLALPAWASGNPQTELDGSGKMVWFWGGKEFAVVSNGDVDNIYIRDGSGRWSTELVLGGAQVYNIPLNILNVSTTPEKMYMVTEQNNEIEIYSSTNGIAWDSIVMNIPERNKEAWLTPVGEYDMLVNTDQGFLVRYQDYNATWNLQVAGTCAPWDNVTVAGDKVFAVIDGQLQVIRNLSTWQQTGFKIAKAVVDLNTYAEIGGKAVPSIDYAQDQTVVAFNPAQPGALAISSDGGNNWQVLDKDKMIIHKGSDPVTITAVAVASDVIFAGTRNGYIVYSTDGGEKWHPVEINGSVMDLAYENEVLLAATNRGIQRLEWQPAEEEPVVDVPSDPTDQDREQPGDNGQVTQPRENIKFVLGQKQYQVGNQTFAMDVASISREGRVYLPVRYLALALGVPTEQILWESPVVTLTKDDTQVKLNVNNDMIQINDRQITGNKPLIMDGRILLPAIWVAEAFGYTVSWDAPGNTMHILPR